MRPNCVLKNLEQRRLNRVYLFAKRGEADRTQFDVLLVTIPIIFSISMWY